MLSFVYPPGLPFVMLLLRFLFRFILFYGSVPPSMVFFVFKLLRVYGTACT